MRQGPLLIALLLAAGCSGFGPEDGAEALQAALSAHQASMTGIGARPVAVPVEGTEPVLVAQPRTEPRGPAPMLAGQLVGQTPETVLGWLGEPRLRRAEGPAEIWHYQASQCHLDLILYRDEGVRPTLRVAFAAARAVGTMRRGEAACLRDIGRGAATPAPAEPPARVVTTGT